MIRVTNGKEKIIIQDVRLNKLGKSNNNVVLKTKHDFWNIEMTFVYNNRSQILRITIHYKGGDENLEIFKNKSTKKDVILLEEKDYQRWKRLYTKMIDTYDYEKEAIIKAGSILLCYEYYKTMYLEENPEKLITSDLFEFFSADFDYNKYKKEIIKESKKQLKEIDKTIRSK